MSAYLGSRPLFLVVAISTHALVGYALGAALFRAPRAGLVGGVVADLDFLFPASWGSPLVHRGITHTALAAALAVGVAAAHHRSTAGGVGVGYVTHLLIDATTPKGIPLAYPVVPDRVGVTLGGHSPVVTALLWICCLGWLSRRRWVPAVRERSLPVVRD